MKPHDSIELDALILVGDDPAAAERCLAALVAVSLDVPLRTWVLEVERDVERAATLHHRCVWTRTVESQGSVSLRINRALEQGNAPLVLVLDGSVEIDADSIRELVQHLRRNPEVAGVGLGVVPRRAHDLRLGAVGPALLLRRAALDLVGPLDDRAFSGMQAEAEAWCRRAERLGVVVQLTARPTVGRTLRNVARLELARPAQDPILERRAHRSRFHDAERGPESLRAPLIQRAREALG